MHIAHEFFQDNKVPFFDISHVVYEKRKEKPGKFVIQGEGHPNENGNKLIADMSWQLFLRKQLHEYVA